MRAIGRYGYVQPKKGFRLTMSRVSQPKWTLLSSIIRLEALKTPRVSAKIVATPLDGKINGRVSEICC